MLAAFLAIIKNPLVILQIIRGALDVIKELKRIFNPPKSPIDEYEKDTKRAEEGRKKAEESDDTSNTFG